MDPFDRIWGRLGCSNCGKVVIAFDAPSGERVSLLRFPKNSKSGDSEALGQATNVSFFSRNIDVEDILEKYRIVYSEVSATFIY